MKKIFLVSAIFFISTGYANCQEVKSEFELIKSIFETEKRGYYEQFMNLSESEEDIFWAIYEDFEIERSEYSKKRLDVLRLFVENYNNMSNKQAKDLMDDIFKYQRADLKLNKKYFRLISAKISETKALRFIQIEEYIHTKIKLEIIEALPFIKE